MLASRRIHFELLVVNRLFMGKLKKNYYAVRVGRVSGIFRSWNDCEQQVKGFPGAVFKGFATESGAMTFMKDVGTNRRCEITRQSSDGVTGSRHFAYSSCCTNSRSQVSDFSGKVVKEGTGKSWCSHRGKGKGRFSARQLARQKYSGDFISRQMHSVARSSPSPSSIPVVYCDGCCLNNGAKEAKAGVGVFWEEGSPHNVSDGLEGPQTNQRAELQSACRAIQTAIDQGYSSIEIRTDSFYTIGAVTKWAKRWQRNGWKTHGWQTALCQDVKNKDDIIKLMALCKKVKIIWTHVYGHSGVPGNEVADTLAKAGALK